MSIMITHERAKSENVKSVTDKLIAYHVAYAKVGNDLNTGGVTVVDKASALFGFLSIAKVKYDDGFIKLNVSIF